MPLDRRITITYDGGDFDADGFFVSGETVTLSLWATEIQDNVTRNFAAGGSVYGSASRVYRIRYLAGLVRAIENGVTVRLTDERYEQVVHSVGEPNEREGVRARRRFLDVLISE